jgi:hypothetical protein
VVVDRWRFERVPFWFIVGGEMVAVDRWRFERAPFWFIVGGEMVVVECARCA